MTANERDWLTIPEVAQELSLSTKTIRKQIAYGELKAHRFGRAIRVKRSDLEKAMKPIKTVANILG